MKYGFIYLWYDRKHKRFYLGCHWGTENDGYICSSSWMRNAYKRRPQDFKRRIIDSQIEKKDLRLRESVWLNMISTEELGKKYYNLMRHTNGGHWPLGKGRSEETKEKIRQTLKGRSPPNKGKKGQIPWNKGKTNIYSEETKRKISESVSKSLTGKPSRAKGSKKTEEWKKQQSERTKKMWNNGLLKVKSPSDATRKKLSDANIGNQNASKK